MYTLPEGRRRKSHISSVSALQPSTPSTPVFRPATHTPPSLSARPPFDWDAARANIPIYSTPTRLSSKLEGAQKGAGKSRPPKVYRQVSWIEKLRNGLDPSLWIEELLSLPSLVPLPESRVLGFVVGAVLNLCHWFVWWATFNDEDNGWELESTSNGNWIWTITGLALLSFSCINVFLTFTTTKLYRMFLAKEPVSSTHSSFVAAELPLEDGNELSPVIRTAKSTLRYMRTIWRFVNNAQTALVSDEASSLHTVQQLEVWNPGEGQLALLISYSPVHALLYQLSPSSLILLAITPSVTILLLGVVGMYTSLLHDRQILASEVMHEYNDKFVYPVIAPLKKDAETMTHENEIVDFRWRSSDLYNYSR